MHLGHSACVAREGLLYHLARHGQKSVAKEDKWYGQYSVGSAFLYTWQSMEHYNNNLTQSCSSITKVS